MSSNEKNAWGWIPLEQRQPSVHVTPTPQRMRWGTTGDDLLLARHGGALESGRSRAICGTPVFDLKPWLGRIGSSEFNEAATPVDTSAGCDPYDPHLDFIFRATSLADRLAEATGIGGVRVWWIEGGHPTNPEQIIWTRARTEITEQFVAEVSDGWRFTLAPTGLRFWQVSLVWEAATASLPGISVLTSMH